MNIDERAVPPALEPVLGVFTDRFGEPERWARSEPERPWVVVARDHVGYLAYDPPSRARLARETTRLRWAEDQGIPVPPILAEDEHLLVTQRIANDPVGGHEYVKLAVAAHDAIARANPPALNARSGHRRAPRRTALARVVRMVSGGLSPRSFLKARNSAARLPHDQLSHGDFHANNVLFDRSASRVYVIDWSYLGYQPAGSDLAYLWSGLESPEDRNSLLEEMIARASDPRSLATVLRWIAIRRLADLLTDRERDRDPTELAHARDIVREAGSIARELHLSERA